PPGWPSRPCPIRIAPVILAGDVGGTKTHLALYEPGASPREPSLQRKFASHEHPSLESIAREFVNHAKARPERAAFGIAGPVVNNRVEATNLPWTMDGASVSSAIGGGRVRLINDLEATAWSLPALGESDLVWIQKGEPVDGNRALIAAGTGLGEAIVHRH